MTQPTRHAVHANSPQTVCKLANCEVIRRPRKVVILGSTKRQAKDPSRFKSMDEVRAHLERRSQGPGGFAGLLTWLGSTAFGSSRQQGTHQHWYRWLLQSKWAQQLTSGVELRPGYVANKADSPLSDGQDKASTDVDPVRLQLLAGLLLCSEQCVCRMARKYPELLNTDPTEVTQRLMLLKGVFPTCNVARMVELLPQGFLQQPQNSMLKRVAAINDALRGSLPGANIDMMVQEDPTILFEDKQSLSSGLRELHDLWDVDEVALGNSNPWELALAIRTMSDQEPPRTI